MAEKLAPLKKSGGYSPQNTRPEPKSPPKKPTDSGSSARPPKRS